MNEQEFAELAAGHALHALTAADERRYREALAAHPEWAHIADTDAQTAAALAEMLPPVAPPQALRADLLAQIAQTPQTPDAADVAPPAPPAAPIAPQPDADVAQPKWGRRLFALAASLVLLVGLGVGTTAVVSQLGRPASVVALDEIRSAPDAADATVQLPGGATATAYWSASLGRSVLVTEELPDLEPGLTYELVCARRPAHLGGHLRHRRRRRDRRARRADARRGRHRGHRRAGRWIAHGRADQRPGDCDPHCLSTCDAVTLEGCPSSSTAPSDVLRQPSTTSLARPTRPSRPGWRTRRHPLCSNVPAPTRRV